MVLTEALIIIATACRVTWMLVTAPLAGPPVAQRRRCPDALFALSLLQLSLAGKRPHSNLPPCKRRMDVLVVASVGLVLSGSYRLHCT